MARKHKSDCWVLVFVILQRLEDSRLQNSDKALCSQTQIGLIVEWSFVEVGSVMVMNSDSMANQETGVRLR